METKTHYFKPSGKATISAVREYEQLTQSGVLYHERFGKTDYKQGDYLVRHANGEIFVCPQEVFETDYTITTTYPTNSDSADSDLTNSDSETPTEPTEE